MPDLRNLVIEQLENLEKQKAETISQSIVNNSEKIEEIKFKAAEEAKALYIKEIETTVESQFKVAEEYLNELLEKLPEEKEE